MPLSSSSCLAQALLLSMRAAAVGPNTFSPCAAKISTIPPPSGSSGPMIVRSMACPAAHSAQAANSIGFSGTFVASCAVPPLPGAQYSAVSSGDLLTAQQSACSRAPPPITRTRMSLFLSINVRNYQQLPRRMAHQRGRLHHRQIVEGFGIFDASHQTGLAGARANPLLQPLGAYLARMAA